MVCCMQMVSDGKIDKVVVKTDRIVITPKGEDDNSPSEVTYYTGVMNDDKMTQTLLDNGVNVTKEIPDSTSSAILNVLVSIVLPFVIIWVGLSFLMRRMLPVIIEDAPAIEAWLGGRVGHHVRILVPQKGRKEQLMLLAEKNARMVLDQDADRLKREAERTTGATREIAELLRLPSLSRLEAYDISNTGGYESVGSMGRRADVGQCYHVGSATHEPGDVSSAHDEPVRPGQVFSIEPGIYLPGDIGVRIEDLVIVTNDGCEVLNSYPKELAVLAI